MKLTQILSASILSLLLCILFGCEQVPQDFTANEETLSNSPAGPINIITNIKYGSYTDENGTHDLLLDLYVPAKGEAKKIYPLAFMIHGGAFLVGTKEEMKRNCTLLAESGFIASSINYRLGWDNGVGDCDGDTLSHQMAAYRALQDSNAALRFLVGNAGNYGIDPNWIFIGGSSAGSSIALNTSYISENIAKTYFHDLHNALGPINTADNQYTNSFTIKGICNMWGALPDSTLIYPKSAQPTISFHGTADDVVPYDYGYNASCSNYEVIYGSLCIHRQLLRCNQPTITNLVIGGGHGPAVYTNNFLMSNTICFWKRVMKGEFIRSRVDTSLVSSCN